MEKERCRSRIPFRGSSNSRKLGKAAKTSRGSRFSPAENDDDTMRDGRYFQAKNCKFAMCKAMKSEKRSGQIQIHRVRLMGKTYNFRIKINA